MCRCVCVEQYASADINPEDGICSIKRCTVVRLLPYYLFIMRIVYMVQRNNKTRHNRITANEAESTLCKQ